MRRLDILIPLEPVPFSRPRFNSNTGAVFNAKPYDRFKRDVKRLVKTEPVLWDCPIKVSIAFFFKRPKRPLFKEYAATKPDLDNLIKAVGDALEGVIWDNDSRICQYGSGTGKFYVEHGSSPRIQLIIEEM